MLETRLVSSLAKIFPDEISGSTLESATALSNEPFSFQVAFKNADLKSDAVQIYVRIETDIGLRNISEYKVGFVPVLRAAPQNADGYFERRQPGLYPDMLLERNVRSEIENDGFWYDKYCEQNENNQLNSIAEAYQGLWFTVNEAGENIKPGKYKIAVVFYSSRENTEIGRSELSLEIKNARLTAEAPLYTCWLHCDCLADIYKTEMFSDEHFRIIESFAKKAAETGMNTVLLPAFTPPLDTPVGKERPTAQLVGVTLKNGGYSFDFSLMERYIRIMLKCGIKYFEHSHLFTQWGAKASPKIIADTEGDKKRIFGWETDSRSEEYKRFLKEYLKALMPFLKRLGIKSNTFFHISDEPQKKDIDYYKSAFKTVKPEIGDCKITDALSNYEFFENGCIDIPVVEVCSSDIDRFINSCEDFWVYYTGEIMTGGYPNRNITVTGARNRIIGIQMYYTGAKGFLHWGLNYYYDVLSHGLFNPAEDPGGYFQVPGSSFIVYPGCGGEAIPSARMKVFSEGLNDYRALCTLEKFIGCEKTRKFIADFFGKVDYHLCPDNDSLLCFRERLNEALESAYKAL